MKNTEQRNREITRRDERTRATTEIAHHLETRTYWGKRMARSAQIMAAARKIYDVLSARMRREQAAAA